MNDRKTTELLNILKSINSQEALDKHLNTNLSRVTKQSFSEYLNSICQNKDLKKSHLLDLCQISKSHFYQIFDASRNPGRDAILKLCIAAGLTLEETDRSLFLGKVSTLYAKDLRDSIIIFCINKGHTLIETNFILDNKNLLPL